MELLKLRFPYSELLSLFTSEDWSDTHDRSLLKFFASESVFEGAAIPVTRGGWTNDTHPVRLNPAGKGQSGRVCKCVPFSDAWLLARPPPQARPLSVGRAHRCTAICVAPHL